ncbi:unnamed protein product [Diamesa serratosioi]
MEQEYNELEEFDHSVVPNVRPGMFVSGWDDQDNDIGIEEDNNPHATMESEILWAATEGKNDIVEEILIKNQTLVNCKDRDGYTPLHKACYNDNYELAQLLLKYKADPDARTEYQWTSLHSACKWNNSKLVALLLQHGANINALSEGEQTPLHIATTVSNCRDTLVTLFMDPNIDPTLKNNSQEIAYKIAKRSGLSDRVFEMVHSAYSIETGLID